LGSVCAVCLHATTFDPFIDFSTTTNLATNPWSFWSTTDTNVSNYNANISLMPEYIVACGPGTSDCWDDSTVGNLVYRNRNATVDDFGSSQNAPGTLSFYPRLGVVDIRFLVPASANYNISGFFNGDALSPVSTRAVIAVDGNVAGALFDLTSTRALNANDPFSFSSFLNAGDTVDFLVAVNASAGNDGSTGFGVSITDNGNAVPEPGSAVTVTLALAGFLILRRRVCRRPEPLDSVS
jgi:hypothetical protein